MEEQRDLKDWRNQYPIWEKAQKKSDVPLCTECLKPMQKTDKDGYQWKFDCECFSKELRDNARLCVC